MSTRLSFATPPRRTRAARSTVVVATYFALTSCAINPATGRAQLNLVNEREEVEQGFEVDQQLRQNGAIFKHEALGRELDKLGQQLAKQTPRAHLKWHFRLLDAPFVNALALPGGWVYVTRQMVGYLNSEDELAAVLGHEIAHVTARHSAQQMTRRKLAWKGMAMFRVLDPRRKHIGRAVDESLERLFLRHSREAELEADALGLDYLEKAGRPAHAMVDMLELLERLDHAQGDDVVPVNSTHPDSGIRRKTIASTIAKETGKTTIARTHSPLTEDWAKLVEGIPMGRNPRRGFFEDDRYTHADAGLQFVIPTDWKLSASEDTLFALSPSEEAIFVALYTDDAEQAPSQNSFLRNFGLPVHDPQVGERNTYKTIFREWDDADGPKGKSSGFIYDIRMDKALIRVFAAGHGKKGRSELRRAQHALESLSLTENSQFESIQQAKIKIEYIEDNESLDTFVQRVGSAWQLEEVALLNQLDVDAALAAGQALKVPQGFSAESIEEPYYQKERAAAKKNKQAAASSMRGY